MNCNESTVKAPLLLVSDYAQALLIKGRYIGEYVIAYFNTFELGHKGYLVLFDVNGREVDRTRLNSSQNQLVINLVNYPDGTYLIRLIVDYQPVSAKLLIKGRK